MSLVFNINNQKYSTELMGKNLKEWIYTLKNQFINAETLEINSTNDDVIGSVLSDFFRENDELFGKCTILKCKFNKISYLPKLPNCRILDCTENNLESLPELYSCEYLSISNNKIKELSALPNCIYLKCDYNYLKSLPELFNCKGLICGYNQITELPNLENLTKNKT